jgi:hypothetical protein
VRTVQARQEGPTQVALSYVRTPGVRGAAGVVSATSADLRWHFTRTGDGWRVTYTPTGQHRDVPGTLNQARHRRVLDELAEAFDVEDQAVARQRCAGASVCGRLTPGRWVVYTVTGPQPACREHAAALREAGRDVRHPSSEGRPKTPRRPPA